MSLKISSFKGHS